MLYYHCFNYLSIIIGSHFSGHPPPLILQQLCQVFKKSTNPCKTTTYKILKTKHHMKMWNFSTLFVENQSTLLHITSHFLPFPKLFHTSLATDFIPSFKKKLSIEALYFGSISYTMTLRFSILPKVSSFPSR